jgi:colanic acid/amylovoran biosynthesis glycosyltransferase
VTDGSALRVAYLVSQYPTLSHTYILREITELRALGAEIETVSISRPDRPFERLTSDEQRECSSTFYVKAAGYRVAVALLRTFALRPVRFLRGLLDATRLGGWNPRVLLAHYLYFTEAVVVGDWMRTRGLAHVHTHFSSTVALFVQGVFEVGTSATIHGSAEFREATAFHLREKVERFDFVRSISNYGRSQMMLVSDPRVWDRIEPVPLGIDPSLYAPRPFVESPAPFRLICVGLLAAVKGYPVLLESIATLVSEGRDVSLRLVGDGPDRKALEQLVAERDLQARVSFAGWLTQEEVRAEYQSADLFALASFAEGVPVVLIEAMAMEIPCVATRITGIPELIEDGVSGLLVTPADPAELASAIGRLMDDGKLRRVIGANGRRRVEERYNLRVNCMSLHALFRRRIAAVPR